MTRPAPAQSAFIDACWSALKLRTGWRDDGTEASAEASEHLRAWVVRNAGPDDTVDEVVNRFVNRGKASGVAGVLGRLGKWWQGGRGR